MKRSFLILIGVCSFVSACSSAAQVTSTIEPESVPEKEVLYDTIRICSFNIQFLGHFKDRNDTLLGQLLMDYDIVVVQEMVAPPVSGIYLDGSRYDADKESERFHAVMLKNGFNSWISEEDTGPRRNHTNSSASELWIAYYKQRLVPDTLDNEPHGFLSDTLVGNSVFKRVPYSFAFQSIDGASSFNLISVHLNPGGSSKESFIRSKEFSGISHWIEKEKTSNCDFIILGDCNIEDKDELNSIQETVFNNDFISLNDVCYSTNTKMYEDSLKGKPYDHVFVNSCLEEDLVENTFQVIDLEAHLKDLGLGDVFFPYEHNYFRTRLSDHVPVEFKLVLGKDKD
jgi:endonuclease/exonuclease/phosphatase family metal-dependent hydrolase